MSYSSHKKLESQIISKEAKLKRFQKYNVPKKRTTGRKLKVCERCGNPRGHVSKYGLHLCRRCFREIATKIGFEKYD